MSFEFYYQPQGGVDPIRYVDEINEVHNFIVYMQINDLLNMILDLINNRNLPGKRSPGTGQFEISYNWRNEEIVNLSFDFGDEKKFNIRIFFKELFEMIRDFGIKINNIFQDRGQSKEESESFLRRLNEISILYEECKKKRDESQKDKS